MAVSAVNSNPVASQAALKGYQSVTGASAQRPDSKATGAAGSAATTAVTVPETAPPTGLFAAPGAGLPPVISNPFRVGVAAYVAIMNEQAVSSMRVEA
jgi:hypothetical protein